MDVTAYNRRDLRLAIILVHEENDDVQDIPFAQGSPDKRSIRAGPNRMIDSLPLSGDDWIIVVANEEIVLTGANGISETTATGDDVQIITVGNGMPDQRCIALGTNGFRDTTNVAATDAIVAEGVSTGPDGICDSLANNTNVLSTDFGTASSIQTYLNTVIYNQAVMNWTEVLKNPTTVVTVNFDLNRDDQFDAICNSAEMTAILAAGQNSLLNFNVFFVDRPNISAFGISCGPRKVFVFVGEHGAGQNVNNTIAHELGHGLGLSAPDHPDELGDPDTANVMHSTAGGEKLRKNQWDLLHP